MKTEIFGGIHVEKLENNVRHKSIFCSEPYQYFLYETKRNEEFQIEGLQSASVYVLSQSENTTITLPESQTQLCIGDAIQIEAAKAILKIVNGVARFLIAGTKHTHSETKGVSFTRSEAIYRVKKPWGYELWINGQHPCYALKKIFIKAGTRTSLQYHRVKRETIVLFQGTAKLHYKKNSLTSNDVVTSADIASVFLEPISVVNVPSCTLHRLEAVTDIMLFETSTPHFDDVVRVHDDSNRINGRVLEEHIPIPLQDAN